MKKLPKVFKKKWLKALRSGEYKQGEMEKILGMIDVASDGCYNWIAGTNGDGYGYVWFAKKYWRAHRLFWVILKGDIPDNKIICHVCDNRKCVNTDHLFIGTKADNNKDRAEKDRNRDQKGTKNNMAKLTVTEVMSILYNKTPRKTIAAKFNVCRQTVDAIKNGKRWPHVYALYNTINK